MLTNTTLVTFAQKQHHHHT
ncbi:Protein of unknown function [Bacillus cereus]|nr:Protein of unknown function [Bacillus cereus]